MNSITESGIKNITPREWIISLPLVWAFSGQLVNSSSYKTMVILSTLSILISCWSYGYKEIIKNITRNKWLQLISLMLITTIAYKEYNVSSSNGELRAYATILVFFISLPKQLANKLFNNLHWLLLISSIFMLIYVTLNTYYWSIPRALWDINPIPYTTISASVAISSACGFFMSNKNNFRKISLIAFTLSLNCVLIGLSRGPLLALLCSLVIVTAFIFYRNKMLMRNRLLSIITIIALSISFNSSHLIERLKNTENSISMIQKGGSDTSIGARLNLWNASIHSIFEKPIFGLGNKEQSYREELAKIGTINQETAKWEHYHNQYLNTLVKKGFVGFALLILLLLYPITQLRKLDTLPASIVLGVLSTICVAGITDIPIEHTQTLIMFMALISLSLLQETLD